MQSNKMEENVRRIAKDEVIEDVPADLFSSSKPLDVGDLLFSTSSPTAMPSSPVLTSNPSNPSQSQPNQQRVYSEFDLANSHTQPFYQDDQPDPEEDIDIQLGGENSASATEDPFASTQPSHSIPPKSSSADAQLILMPSSNRLLRSDSTASSVQADILVSTSTPGSVSTPLTSTGSSNATRTVTVGPAESVYSERGSTYGDFSNSTSPLKPSPLSEITHDTKALPNVHQQDMAPAPQKIHLVDQGRLNTPVDALAQNEILRNTPTPPPKKPLISVPSSISMQAIASPRLNPLPPALDPIFFTLPTRKWTDPTTFFDVPYNDPLGDIIGKTFAPNAVDRPIRKLLSVEEALSHDDPYLVLMKASSWRALAILARHDIVATHPQDVDKIMHLWAVRWYALFRLRLFHVIESELEKLGDFDSPDMRFEKYPELWPGRVGFIVSIDVRLLVSQIPALKNANHLESVHRLYKILYSYAKLYTSGAISGDVWETTRARVMGLLSTLMVAAGDLVSGISIVKQATLLNPDSPDLMSLLGRMFLQIGDVSSARHSFASVEEKLGISLSLSKSGTADIRAECASSQALSTTPRPDLVLSNRAFLLLAEGHYDLAVAHLTELITQASTFVSGINNLAIAQLYMGNVSQASNFLESIAIDDPLRAGSSPEILFNLCTLYDLTDHSFEKKKRLLSQVVAKSTGDDFRPECLKLS